MRKLAWLFRRREKEDELREELEFHLEEEAGERREMGNLTLIQEDTRAAWGWVWVEQLAQDLRYALRAMRRNPGFALLAAASLALGIGANAAIYSFMDAVLVRELPVRDPASLAVLNWHFERAKDSTDTVVHSVSGYYWNDPKLGRMAGMFPYPAFELLRQAEIFSTLFAYHPAGKLNLMIRGEAEVANGECVSGEYFRGLEMIPAAGRLIADEDDRAGASAAVVLSYAYAQRRFGRAESAAGERIAINNLPFTVIGVAPMGFFGVDPSKAPEVYLPMHAEAVLDPEDAGYLNDHYYWIEMMGRLGPGVTRGQAQAQAAPLFARWVAPTAQTAKERANLPELVLRDGAGGVDRLRRNYSEPLWILTAMVGLILAIGCANLANLLLARATARRREMAVRLSVGASRWRVMRQLLTETLLLAASGGAAGILLAMWGVRVLSALLGEEFTSRVGVNWHVVALAAALSILSGLVFGLAPAFQATRVDVMPALKGSHVSERRRWGIEVLVAAQMAISLALLVAAGLFVRTLGNLQSIPMGFNRNHVLTFRVNARQAGHRDPEIISFYRDLQTRLASIPGVRAVSVANAPLIGDGAFGWAVVPAGKPEPKDPPTGHGSGFSDNETRVLETGPGFFTTMQIPILAGREFDERDRAGSAAVAIVNEKWVQVNLEGRNPIGVHVVSDGPHHKPVELEIAGLVKNAKYDDFTMNPAIVYMAFAQNLGASAGEMTYFLRTAGDPLAAASAAREMVHQADARIPVTHLETQAVEIENEMSQEILFARLSTAFSILALAIACVGLYGTMSYAVARRTGEIGIRMALGAHGSRVVGMVMGQGIAMAAIGLAIGAVAALGLGRMVESLLYGVKGNDAWSIGVAVGVLLAAALGAAYGPARRASRIDPMAALRRTE